MVASWTTKAFLYAVCAIATASIGSSEAADLYISPPDLPGLRAMFTQPAQWAETRKHVTGLIQPDHVFVKTPDADLRDWCTKLRTWGLVLQLEVGAIKEWSTQGAKTFAIEAPGWDKMIGLGCPVSSIAMDEPLDKTLGYLHRPISYAVDEIADFVAAVRRKYPSMQIGDIEPYPSVPLSAHLTWLRALNAKLVGAGVGGLDFYRIDPDWVSFNIAGRGEWKEIKSIEDSARSTNIRFSLIYWDSDYPSLKPKGLASDRTWYVGIMHEGYAYANIGGKPDQFVIESWISAPSVTLPDSAQFSFTNSVLDFADQFAR